MHALDHAHDEDAGIVFRDILTLALCGFLVCVVLLLPHLAPPRATAAVAAQPPPGNLMVEIRWPDGLDADVDLWVQAPGDVPVGYSNKGGGQFDLLRDDLGSRDDASGLNYEIAFARSIGTGEYTVNLHLFRNPSGSYPVPVQVRVTSRGEATAAAQEILTRQVTLGFDGEELTVFRFRLAADGSLLPDSVNQLQRPLRAGSVS